MKVIIWSAMLLICAVSGFSQRPSRTGAKIKSPVAVRSGGRAGDVRQSLVQQLVADGEITAVCVSK